MIQKLPPTLTDDRWISHWWCYALRRVIGHLYYRCFHAARREAWALETPTLPIPRVQCFMRMG